MCASACLGVRVCVCVCACVFVHVHAAVAEWVHGGVCPWYANHPIPLCLLLKITPPHPTPAAAETKLQTDRQTPQNRKRAEQDLTHFCQARHQFVLA